MLNYMIIEARIGKRNAQEYWTLALFYMTTPKLRKKSSIHFSHNRLQESSIMPSRLI